MMAVAGSNPTLYYEFGGFSLDLRQRMLLRSTDRAPIPLSPKVFDTLLCLVERHGELLDKTTLLKTVWPNVVVEENSLNQNISAIRRALGEAPGEHRFVLTEPGRGYRFVAAVRTVAEHAAPAPAEPAGSPRAAVERKSIAVLPFVNLTGDPSKEYFSDGMAEELIHILARVPGLKVPSRTSSFCYKGRNLDLREIARDLDVGAVLEGSIRSAGERIRVTTQLIDGVSGYHLWSENYDRQFGDLFELQDELARAIVATLRLALDGRYSAQLLGPPTRDLEAYHLYLRAMAVQGSMADGAGIGSAIKMLQEALKRDRGFGRARSGIVSLWAIGLVLDVPLPGSLDEIEQEVQGHLEADPTPGATYSALGTIDAAHGRWLRAHQHFQQAFEADDSDPLTHQAYGLHFQGTAGYLRGYADAAQRSQRLAPGWIVNNINLAVAHTLLGEADVAEKNLSLCIDLGVPPSVAPLADIRCQLAVRAGRYEEAAASITSALRLSIPGTQGAEAVRQIFDALATGTGIDTAVRALDDYRRSEPPQGWTQIMMRRFMLWYTQLGALDRSFEVVAKSLDHFGRSGTIGTAWAFLWMAEMLPFRRDARFQALCQSLSLFDLWERNGPPDRCELSAGKLICH